MHEPFDADTFNHQELRRIIQSFDIECVVETGIYHGVSTSEFARMVPFVIAIESSDQIWELSNHLNRVPNVIRIKADSAIVLDKILPLKFSTLFYLDAHWQKHSPLLEELDAIKASGMKPVIVIHDFFNPEHPDFGYEGEQPGNTYDIGAYRWELIEDRIISIYGESGFQHWYNSRTEGSRRGVVYIAPARP